MEMLIFVTLNVILYTWKDVLAMSAEDSGDFGENLIEQMKNDVNLDLSVDEEYEDLRAELLAYHTAFASLTSTANRRSMMTTPCWDLGGICVNYKLCSGFHYLSEVRGCKDKLNVCCFTWNRYKVSDFKDKGIGNAAMPWPIQYEFGGGDGIKVVEPEKKKKKKIKKNPRKLAEQEIEVSPETLALLVERTIMMALPKIWLILVISETVIAFTYERDTAYKYPKPSPIVSPNYKDIYKGKGGKPQFGNAHSTCWARGGSCVDMRDCPGLRFDSSVSGCTRGFKVCCQNFRFPSATVGKAMRRMGILDSSEESTDDDGDGSKYNHSGESPDLGALLDLLQHI